MRRRVGTGTVRVVVIAGIVIVLRGMRVSVIAVGLMIVPLGPVMVMSASGAARIADVAVQRPGAPFVGQQCVNDLVQ